MNTFTKSIKITYQNWFLYFAAAVFILALFVGANILNADTSNEDQHGKSLEDVLQKIRDKQGLDPDDAINPRTISDEDLEELGEAVMSVMFPDPKQHEIMDNMMGGEGSRRLARMHKKMGYNYLSGRGYGMMGCMMGGRRSGMMGRYNRGNTRGMMGGMM